MRNGDIEEEVDSNGEKKLGDHPFTLGLWVGNKVTPGTTQDAHDAIMNLNTETFFQSGTSSPAQLTNCPWCGHEIRATSSNIKVEKDTSKNFYFLW